MITEEEDQAHLINEEMTGIIIKEEGQLKLF